MPSGNDNYMGNSFFEYMQQVELMVFFSGYPLLYALLYAVFEFGIIHNSLKKRTVSLLPFAYALAGTLYLGLLLKSLFSDYSFENIRMTFHRPYLILWGLFSLLFWIPALAKKTSLSLIHSFVFFYFIFRDIFIQIFDSSADRLLLQNDMSIYSISFLINLGTFLVILLCSFIVSHFKKRTAS